MHSKQILNYFAVSQSFFSIVHVITIYTTKTRLLHNSEAYKSALPLPAEEKTLICSTDTHTNTHTHA